MKQTLLILALVLIAAAVPAQTLELASGDGDQYAPCPRGSIHYKIENGGSGKTWDIYAPPGYAIVQTQVKASNEHQPKITYLPPLGFVSVASTTKHDISHVHVCKVKDEEPPPCKIGEPCFCEENPEHETCKPPPEPQCEYDFYLDNVYFDYGFADAGGAMGSGCGNHGPFIGDPGDVFHLEVCLDADVVNGEFIPPFQTPWVVRSSGKVGNESSELTGKKVLTYGDPEFKGCTATAEFAYLLYVLSTHDVDYCEPGEECWCKKFPDAKECAPPPPRCDAWSDLRVGLVAGLDQDEACFETLSPHDTVIALPPELGDFVTACWLANGSPELSVLGNNGKKTFPDLPKKGWASMHVPEGCGGWISAISRTEICTRHDLVRFEILRDAPEICLPFLP